MVRRFSLRSFSSLIFTSKDFPKESCSNSDCTVLKWPFKVSNPFGEFIWRPGKLRKEEEQLNSVVILKVRCLRASKKCTQSLDRCLPISMILERAVIPLTERPYMFLITQLIFKATVDTLWQLSNITSFSFILDLFSSEITYLALWRQILPGEFSTTSGILTILSMTKIFSEKFLMVKRGDLPPSTLKSVRPPILGGFTGRSSFSISRPLSTRLMRLITWFKSPHFQSGPPSKLGALNLVTSMFPDPIKLPQINSSKLEGIIATKTSRRLFVAIKKYEDLRVWISLAKFVLIFLRQFL